jgi:hypothetical protein
MKTPMIERARQRMADFGILPDKGITLVPHDVLTQALARIAVDEGISGTFYIHNLVSLTIIRPLTQLLGRAIAIVPEGVVDIGDDIDDRYDGT